MFFSPVGFVVVLGAVSALAGQSQIFTDPGGDFTIELPNSTWRAVSQSDSAHQHLEFIYGDRNDGYLRIRKEVVDAGTTASDLASRDRDTKLRFEPGFVEGKQESFSGRLRGVTLAYEFTYSGKPMAGRIYYLQADNRTIYTLRFTGQRSKLVAMRNQTDVIARSFALK